MGIDVYMKWKGQTEEERDAQLTGFSIAHGHVGYLREAYHGEPYATSILVPEGFEGTSEEGVPISASVMRERLPLAIKASIARELQVYGRDADEDDDVPKAFKNFVELAERKEAETGEPVRIIVSY